MSLKKITSKIASLTKVFDWFSCPKECDQSLCITPKASETPDLSFEKPKKRKPKGIDCPPCKRNDFKITKMHTHDFSNCMHNLKMKCQQYCDTVVYEEAEGENDQARN